ncbi:MAG TPA: [FeFe] hydrogenase H-cluster radical SAM maturase HydE [Phycisphaerae bacterium]|nr:[FeFe] hydrogenase H-cluster radical SAM maturase HydE [Phycisphaerales bacterium]HRX85460.1 [FeFe] hydrogenase H-cluster radical SAM maturase HydE [Phycisphaerae bacterium]
MLSRATINHWLCEHDPRRLEELWAEADRTRSAWVGDAVHLRGLIEVSNHCVRACHYCGIRAENAGVTRYRLTHEQVMTAARAALAFGCGTVVLQAGEDRGLSAGAVAAMIRGIKALGDIAVTLSLGERSDVEFAQWRAAGADRYLLRIETSNETLYRAVHPPRGRQPSERKAMLARLRALGYAIGSGVLVGLPGQTWSDLADDIVFLEERALDMIGVGPFIAHPATPLGAQPAEAGGTEQVPADELTTCKVMALARLACPWANIPSTTALSALDPERGRESGLKRGANVVMPNFTPLPYRAFYEIYPGKAACGDEPDRVAERLKDRITRLGRPIAAGRGDAVRPVESAPVCA